jgi:UDP-N-acetyl-D-glucosamine dehydrogenase
MKAYKKVIIIGQGYVGLNLALYAANNNEVIGFDLNADLVAKLNNGISHIEDVKNSELSKLISEKKYRATSNSSQIGEADIYVIAVPTPLDSKREPDLKYVDSAAELIGRNAKRPALIINESTSYPGTLRNVIRNKIESISELKHWYAASPERVDPGRKDYTQLNTPRLIGAIGDEALNLARDFYSTFCGEIHLVSSPEVAEAAKLFENTFRQVNIALVNEFAQITNQLKIPIREVLDAANTKPYGFMKFNPGPGVGGHCIPVDPSYLSFIAEKNGISARFIDLANQVNLDMPKYVIARCEKILGGLKGMKILIAGVSYKPNIADVRETPAELIRDKALASGAEVSWFDPIVEEWEPGKVTELKSGEFDLVIFQTIHTEMDIEKIKGSAKYVFDCTGKVPGVASI